MFAELKNVCRLVCEISRTQRRRVTLDGPGDGPGGRPFQLVCEAGRGTCERQARWTAAQDCPCINPSSRADLPRINPRSSSRTTTPSPGPSRALAVALPWSS